MTKPTDEAKGRSRSSEARRCALCRVEPRDEQSHVIPAFVVRWLKETSPTGFIRTTSNPNQRKQDGIKCPLLCRKCEDLFSLWEKKFAEDVFHKVHRQGDSRLNFSYEGWLAKFCVASSWRSMAYLAEANPNVELPFGQSSEASVATERWRKFILGEEKRIDPYWQYFFLLDTPVSVPDPSDRADLEVFIKRGLDCDTMHSANEAYVFTKMCQVLVVGTIRDANPQQWRGPKIGLSGGVVKCPREDRVSPLFFDYFKTAIASLRKARAEILPEQLGKMEASLTKRRDVK